MKDDTGPLCQSMIKAYKDGTTTHDEKREAVTHSTKFRRSPGGNKQKFDIIQTLNNNTDKTQEVFIQPSDRVQRGFFRGYTISDYNVEPWDLNLGIWRLFVPPLTNVNVSYTLEF